MALPPDVITAGLDGEPVLLYEPLEQVPSQEEAQLACRQLLKQARARVRDPVVEDSTMKHQVRQVIDFEGLDEFDAATERMLPSEEL